MPRLWASAIMGVLERDGRFDSVVHAETAELGLAALHATSADVVVVDARAPDVRPADLTERILKARPESAVLLIAGSADDELRRALLAGARGYVGVDVEVAEFAAGIERVARGEVLISPNDLVGIMQSESEGRIAGSLTPREAEVLVAMSEGVANQDLAARFGISVHTVRNHVQRVIAKLGAHSRLEAVVIASRSGLIRDHQDTR